MNNTILRTISGTGFIAVMLAGLLINKFLFAALVMFLMATMMHEFFTITMNDRYKFSRLLSILSGLILFSLIFCVSAYGLEVKYVSIAILPIMIVMVNSLYVKDKTEFGKFSDIYTGFLYIAVPLSLSNLIVFFPNPATSSNEFNGIILLCFSFLSGVLTSEDMFSVRRLARSSARSCSRTFLLRKPGRDSGAV